MGYNFLGSAIHPDTDFDLFHHVEIRFSNTFTQKAYRYIRGGDPNYEYGGYYEVPFTVWDIEENRQLNAAFVEWTESSVYDNTWGPSANVDEAGGREYLIILNSDYSGMDPYNTPINYPDLNLYSNGDQFDVLYALSPMLETGHSLSELADGQRLVFIFQEFNENGAAGELYFEEVCTGDIIRQAAYLECFTSRQSRLLLEITDTLVYSVTCDTFTLKNQQLAWLNVLFKPGAEKYYEEYLYIIDSVSGAHVDEIVLTGKSSEFYCGDASGDGNFNIMDVLFIINYLYKGGPAPVPDVAADTNGSGNLNIMDVLYIINYLYKGGPEPIC